MAASPLASGRRPFGPLVGTRDVMVLHSVVGILGLNPLSRAVFRNAAGAMAGMVRDMIPDRERLRAAAGRGFSTATDLADWLARELGLPFREAHHITGAIVRRAELRGCALADLPLSEMQAVQPAISAAVLEVLDPERSAASRASLGGTAPERVREAIADARRRFLA